MHRDRIIQLTRRSLLAGSAAIAASACISPGARRSSRMLGVADITVRSELAADYAGTLRQIGQIGYTHFGFRLARMSPREAAEPAAMEKVLMVRDAGLAIHTVRLGYSEPFPTQMEIAARMGAQVIAYTAAPVFFRGERMGETTREAFDAWLPELGEIATLARANGLRLAFHNHWWDHVPLEGETPLSLIARAYSPEEVGFEIDLAWAYLGGENPYRLVRRMGDRVLSMHFKDVDPTRGDDYSAQLVAPGEGVLAYDTLIPALDLATTAPGYVEVDNPADGLLAARTALRTIAGARLG